jgi:hypothetical protein
MIFRPLLDQHCQDGHQSPERGGDPTAENAMATLSGYYLQTDEYQRALQGGVNLAVGRKGSGKTAPFIQLRDKRQVRRGPAMSSEQPPGLTILGCCGREPAIRLVSERVPSWEWESLPRREPRRARDRPLGLGSWLPKLIEAKPSNNFKLEQSISESERTS